MLIRSLFSAVLGYLLGSISTGILYSKFLLGKDVRTAGSNNAGASNMLRVHGVLPGILTFVGDCVKAIIAITLGRVILQQHGAMIAGLFAVIGHNWPVFFSFKGGKGIACCSAVFILCYPLLGIPAVIIAVLVILITRYISLGSIVMTVVFAILTLIFEGIWPAGVWAVLLMIMAVYRHRGNVQRLISGTERKIGQREQ